MAKALVLRTCDVNRKAAYGEFVWPESGPVECPDWSPEPKCGNGLHGWLWGEGDGTLANWAADAKWLVVEVEESEVVNLQGKVKFPRGEVLFCGSRLDATSFLAQRAPGKMIVGGTVTAGYAGTATAGDAGTATAGDAGTATAGYAGTATAGYAGTATAGARGTATAGDAGTATAGARGTATAGYAGTATAGDAGTATAGYAGTATAGARGTATAGYAGTATAGACGILNVRWWDGQRYRIATAYVGENGIEPNVAYILDDKGNFVRKAT